MTLGWVLGCNERGWRNHSDGGQNELDGLPVCLFFFFLSLKIWIKNNFFFLVMSHSILVPQPGLNPALWQ